jgi:pyruvate formate lyase activating enzyme
MTVDELIHEAEKDRPFYRKSGGGITVSGGEPTLQHEFLKEFLGECKERGLNTAIESHGYVEWPVLETLVPYIDLFQIDIKHMDSDLHNKVVGVPNDQILSNIKDIALKVNKKVAIRIPLIPGFNDTDENIYAVAEFARQVNSSGNLTMVHILPYHAFGQSKYESLDRVYSMTDTKPPNDDSIKKILQIFESYGLPVQQGG